MKFLVIWEWDTSDAREVSRRFVEEWKPPEGIEFLYPIHTLIGKNMSFAVIECDKSDYLQKIMSKWSDICTFETTPIIDSREAVNLAKQ